MAKDDETVVDNAGPLPEEPGPNPNDLAAWAISLSKGTGAPDVELPDPDEVLPDPTKAVPAAKADETPATPAKQERPALMAKDGKHEIPYSRLEESNAARDKALAEAAEAKQQAEAAATQLAAAKAELEALQKGAETGKATAAVAEQSADELEVQVKAIEDSIETVGEEAPWMVDSLTAQAKTMRALLNGMRTVQQELTNEKTARQQAVQQEKETQEQAVIRSAQEAIDDNAALKHWSASKPAFFQAAIEIDNALREKPEWKDKPLKDRFSQVVKDMVAEYGETILPSGFKPDAKPTVVPKKLPDVTQAGIHSLTDLPGGTPTAQSPLESSEGADPSALAQSLIGMQSPEDIIRWATRPR